ncbi:hypothetical protein B0T24DRAFT_718070 [Lasiosphaeria ovina]|uniref:Uncharacterized protein n=1 Tax=Lasiosphaeria ovina TaxID=92902 RepID=A0AAE0NFX6_9PEZI|nr:hypothetical protein B0T24DRAFT_718070 [Lasiosphaeria ovina]
MDSAIDIETFMKEVEESFSDLSLLSKKQPKQSKKGATQKRAASKKRQDERIRAELRLDPATPLPSTYLTISQRRREAQKRKKARIRAELGLPPFIPPHPPSGLTRTQRRRERKKRQQERHRAALAAGVPLPDNEMTGRTPTEKRRDKLNCAKERKRAALEAGLPLPEENTPKRTSTQKRREMKKRQQARMRDATTALEAEGEAQPKDEFLETETGMQQELCNQMTAKLHVSNYATIRQSSADRHTSSHTSPKKRRKPSPEKARRAILKQRHHKAWNKKMAYLTLALELLTISAHDTCPLAHAWAEHLQVALPHRQPEIRKPQGQEEQV